LTPNDDSENLVWEKLADDKNCSVILSEAKDPTTAGSTSGTARRSHDAQVFLHAKDALAS
jgi:hypothetical protein